MKSFLAVIFLSTALHAGQARTPVPAGPAITPTPIPAPAWHTLSGFPEAAFKGISPAEVTGLLSEQMEAQGFEPLTENIHGGTDAERITPADDYHSAFLKKDVNFGIQWVAVFEYLTLPKKIKVIARPEVVSWGVLVPADPHPHDNVGKDYQLVVACNTALLGATAELESDK